MALMLAALAAVEIATSPGAARTAFRCALALGGFGVMALWVRVNRVMLDAQDWCECAAEKLTVRVIPSRAQEPERTGEEDETLEEVATWGLEERVGESQGDRVLSV